jgi:hypothetical protein
MVKKFAYDKSAESLLRPAQNAIFFDGWVPADTAKHDIFSAELSRLSYATEEVVAQSLEAVGFELVDFIGGDQLSERIETHGTEAFIARNKTGNEPLTVLAFRGTESAAPEDAIADALILPKESKLFPDCRVHAGFLDRFQVVHSQISKRLASVDGPLLITGHSLGGALATLAAAAFSDIPATLITFGSPLIGDAAFARSVPNVAARPVQRYVDCCDVVARIPPERFDRGHFSQLLEELAASGKPKGFRDTLAEGARALVSAALEKVFAQVNPPIEFTHVCPPIYIRADGERAEGISPANLLADQQGARADYKGQTPPQSGLTFSAVLHDLTRVVSGGQVPSRDLADHAPINYLSAFTGRI